MPFPCHLCGKSFSRRLKLENHLTKNVCQKPLKNICSRCSHHFAPKQMYQYHIEHNVCQHVPQPQPQPLLKPKIVLKVQCQKPTVDELLMELSETKEELSETKGKLSLAIEQSASWEVYLFLVFFLLKGKLLHPLMIYPPMISPGYRSRYQA